MITNLYIKLPKNGNSLKILSDFGIIQAKYEKSLHFKVRFYNYYPNLPSHQ